FADVRSGDKCLFTPAGENHHSYIRIHLDCMERAAKFFHGCHVQGVEYLRTVYRHVGNSVLLSEEDVFQTAQLLRRSHEILPTLLFLIAAAMRASEFFNSTLKFHRRWVVRIGIIVETFARLPSKPASHDQAFEQRRRGKTLFL